jgi:PAS domain S-box-containing protein
MDVAPLIRVLLVFPDAGAAASIKKALAASDDPVDAGIASGVEEAMSSLTAAPFDLIVSALDLSDGGAGDIAQRYPIVPVVAVGPASEKNRLDEAIKAGVADFILEEEGWDQSLGFYVHRLWRIRRRLASELGHIAKRYEDLVDALPDVIYELDPAGNFSFINQSVKMLGYRPEDLIGKHFSVLLYEEDVPHVSREHILPFYTKNRTGARNAPKLFDERRGVDRKTENLEIRLKRGPGGSPRENDMIATVISYGEIASAGAYRAVGDHKEKIFVGTVGIIRDITLRRKSEDMLRKMYQAVDQSPAAVAVLDHELVIEYVNPAFFAMTGTGPDLVIGRKIGDFLDVSSDRDGYDDLIASVRAGIDWHGDIRCARTGTDPFWSSATLSAIRSPSGLVTQYLCLLEDITGKRMLDDLLRQAKAGAEDSNQAKSEFLANMSQELRAPLQGVISLVEVLLAEKPKKEQVPRMDAIRSSAESMVAVLNDLLDLSKIEARAMDLVPEDFDVNEFAKTTLAPFRMMAENKGLSLNYQVEDGGTPKVRVDRGRLSQIVSNLVSNAVRFTDKGGVDVRFSIRSKGEIPALTVSVRDTGIGISAVDQRKLFTHFSQIGNSRSAEKGGTGLGLAVSKELAFRLGGDIWVESAPGSGSTFSFFVPVEAGGGTGRPADEGIAAPRSYKVLVAEDNPVNRDSLRFALEKAGHRVEVVSDGYGAIAALGKGDFDVVLMDVQMPGMDGVAATKAVRSYLGADYDPNIPIIALASFTGDEYPGTFESAGFDAYTSKPVNPRMLVTLIDDTVRTKVRFDLTRLKRQYVSSPDDLRRVLMIAGQDLPKRIDAFSARNDAGDLAGAENALNEAVGILASLGALRALQLVKRYRKAAKEGDAEFASIAAGDLRRECLGIRKLVKKALSEL